MFNPHIKFEMSTITCSEEMKGNRQTHGHTMMAITRV